MKQNLLNICKHTVCSTLLLFSIANSATAQVGIGIKIPDASAMLDVFANDKGLLFPRVSLVNITDAVTINHPATGLTVWNTNMAMVDGDGIGVYSNFGTKDEPKWLKLANSEDLDGMMGAGPWLLTGNIVDATHFIGTNNAFSFVVKTNAAEAMRIDENQLAGIGTAPFAKGGGIRLNVDSAVNTAESYHLNGRPFAWDGNKVSNVLLGQTNNTTLTGIDNTLVGASAGRSLAAAAGNVIMGGRAGFTLKTGGSNVLLGRNAGSSITQNLGVVAIGINAGSKDDATGNPNNVGGSVYIGANAGQNITSTTTNGGNVVIGLEAGSLTTATQNNISIGAFTGSANTGDLNTFVGPQAGLFNTNGSENTFIHLAGVYNAGDRNTYVGAQAGGGDLDVNKADPDKTSNGSDNTAFGQGAGFLIRAGSSNTLIGANAGASTWNDFENTSVGFFAGKNMGNINGVSIPSSKNTVIGVRAGEHATKNLNFYAGYEAGKKMSGDKNIFIGGLSGLNPAENDANDETSTGNENIFIGSNAYGTLLNMSNSIAIGTNAKAGASNVIQLGNQAQNISIGNNNGGIPLAKLHVDGNAIIEKNLKVGKLNLTDVNVTSFSASFLTATNTLTAHILNVTEDAKITGNIQAASSLITGNAVVNGTNTVAPGIQTVEGSELINTTLTTTGSLFAKTNMEVDGTSNLKGNTTATNVDVNGTLTVGALGTPITKIVKVTVNQPAFSVPTKGGSNPETYAVPGAQLGGTVICSIATATLSGEYNHISISSARVSAPGFVEIRFTNENTTADPVDNLEAISLNIAVIN